MSNWQMFDDLMELEKAQKWIKSHKKLLETKQTILANRERDLLTGGWRRHGLSSADQARREIQLLQEHMEVELQTIEKAQEALAQGPQACRTLEAQRAALERQFDAFSAGDYPGPAPDAPPVEPPTRGVVRPAGARPAAPSAATGDIPAPGVGPEVPPPELPPAAPVAAGEEALAGGEAATGAGAEAVAASRLGRVLIGAAVILGLAAGGYWAYNHFTSPPASSPSSASFNINGDYNGTANGAKCEKPECYVTVTKVSDPSGPGPDDAGKITVNFTAVNWTPASTGVASVINMKVGPMNAWLQQDGTVQETGYNPWTTVTDTTPGSGAQTSASYKLSGKFTGGTNGSPSYTLTMVLSGTTYDLRGVRTG
ncbi:hypothetical protein [Streptomyces nondiastaticus]|uniref:CBM2 domain-containing protein n=1 Tax=Streptomyces nondiastaticus TaxID=3154512 RepID=A0ABW6TSW6_9ACTN